MNFNQLTLALARLCAGPPPHLPCAFRGLDARWSVGPASRCRHSLPAEHPAIAGAEMTGCFKDMAAARGVALRCCTAKQVPPCHREPGPSSKAFQTGRL